MARHDAREEPLVVPVVAHVPARQELAHHDRDERNRVLEARAVVDRLRMSVHKIET